MSITPISYLFSISYVGLKLGKEPLTFDEKQQVVRLLVDEVLVDSVNEQLVVKHVIPLDKSFPLRSGRNGGSFACQGEKMDRRLG